MTIFMIILAVFTLMSMIWYEAGYRRGKDEMRYTTQSIYDMYLKDSERLNGKNNK